MRCRKCGRGIDKRGWFGHLIPVLAFITQTRSLAFDGVAKWTEREKKMQGINGLGHVAIKVTDLDRSLDYYINKLGFPEMLRLTKDDGTVWLVYLRITDEQYLEVFPGAENDRAPGWNANGMNHMCLTVDNIDEVLARIAAAGLELLLPLKTAIDGNRQAWLEDPDGNRIELMEMAKDSLQYAAIRRLREAGALT